MILGVDPGLRHCGWAVVEPRTARVIDLGVEVNERDGAIANSADRSRRAVSLASSLGAVIGRYDCGVIAAEAMSFPRGVAGIASLALAWGVLAAIATSRGLQLHEVPPKRWQRAVLPGTKGKINYAAVESLLRKYAHGQAAVAFAGILPGRQNHALDAAGIGMYAALGQPLFPIAFGDRVAIGPAIAVGSASVDADRQGEPTTSPEVEGATGGA